MTEPDDDAELVRRLRAGDEEALAALYARWASSVYSIALRSVTAVDVAEEITRRVFTAAWERRSAPDPGRTPVSWLIGLTREKIVEVAEGELHRPGVTMEFAEVTRRVLVADELARLDPEPQQVLRLALFEGLGVEEIAGRTHLPSDTVEKHLRQSLLQLRGRLEVRTDAR